MLKSYIFIKHLLTHFLRFLHLCFCTAAKHKKGFQLQTFIWDTMIPFSISSQYLPQWKVTELVLLFCISLQCNKNKIQKPAGYITLSSGGSTLECVLCAYTSACTAYCKKEDFHEYFRNHYPWDFQSRRICCR